MRSIYYIVCFDIQYLLVERLRVNHGEASRRHLILASWLKLKTILKMKCFFGCILIFCLIWPLKGQRRRNWQDIDREESVVRYHIFKKIIFIRFTRERLRSWHLILSAKYRFPIWIDTTCKRYFFCTAKEAIRTSSRYRWISI